MWLVQSTKQQLDILFAAKYTAVIVMQSMNDALHEQNDDLSL